MAPVENDRARRGILHIIWLFLMMIGKVAPNYGGVSEIHPTSRAIDTASVNTITARFTSNEGDLVNIVLFDGVCNFCNKWVDIMLQLDTGKKIRFCALQSPKGKLLSSKIGRAPHELSSVVLIKSIENNEIYVKSDAILKVTEQFGFFWYMFSAVNLALPLFVRNCIYDIVAKNRYNILGKRDQCRCADGDYSDRFM
jgi:predicted DCC family thiol-disulfide oxidoreductase YuxK